MMIYVMAATSNVLTASDIPNAGQISRIFDDISRYFVAYAERMEAELLSGTIWLQLAGILISFFLALLIVRVLRTTTGHFFADLSESFRGGRYEAVSRSLVFPAIAAGLIWLVIAGFAEQNIPVDYMRIVGSVLVAYLIIRAFARPGGDPFWRWTIVALASFGALLAIMRLAAPLVAFVDSLTLPFGDSLSLLDVFKVIVIAVALIWGASFLSRIVEARIGRSQSMTPSVRGLFGQLIRIVMIGIAIFIALNMIGIDLTAFAVFTGALGVGIGFGLQSIFSNFVAGIIIILEKTLKVGDFVDLEGGITGEVREINVRSTLVTTNDNIDMLIPNSEFINNRVINWTLREAKRRIHVPFGVAYGTDKDLVKKVVLEAAASVEFTVKKIKNRNADVWLVGFGDSSLDFELIVWLTDEATKKPAKVHATYCWAIETALAKHDIVIPFPQRDLHMITPPE